MLAVINTDILLYIGWGFVFLLWLCTIIALFGYAAMPKGDRRSTFSDVAAILVIMAFLATLVACAVTNKELENDGKKKSKERTSIGGRGIPHWISYADARSTSRTSRQPDSRQMQAPA